MSELIVGIDLGTTNSVLAVVQDGKIKVVDIHGRPTMPSCVGLDSSGQLLVGEVARNQLIAAPDATLLSTDEDVQRNGDCQENLVNLPMFQSEEFGERPGILAQPGSRIARLDDRRGWMRQ
jgi:molecular chaperone DnaK (HSP70)